MTRIHRRNTLKLVIILSAFLFAIAAFIQTGSPVEAAANGPSPSHTDAPGEDNCTACHVGSPVNTGGGSLLISGIPHDYLPGHQYPVTVTISDPIAIIWGFQITAIDSNGTGAGTFAVPGPPDNRMQIKNGFVNSEPRDYVEHTIHGTAPPPMVFGSNSWTFTWTAPATRVGKVSFFAAGNGANSNNNPTGDQIYTTSNGALSGTATANFDGDSASDIAWFRPSTANWHSVNIQTSATQDIQFGSGSHRVVAGDYDGDGETDLALFDPATAQWNIQRSTLGPTTIQWGAVGDIPVPGDYDGDGVTDAAVFRSSTGQWIINEAGGMRTVDLGQAGDKPVPSDYDGDAKTDVGVFRPSDSTWYLIRSTAGAFQLVYGAAGDKPVPADYDGDGLTDIARFRPANATWYLNLSSDGETSVQFGAGTDRPVPADYDGDGTVDLAVFTAGRKKPLWRIRKSTTLDIFELVSGTSRDVPIVTSYFPQ